MTSIKWDQWITPGDVLVDVGANSGAFTTAFARATGPTGRVIAFEPDPSCAAKLRALKDVPARIDVRECAVGGQHESKPFFLSKNPAQNTHYQASIERAVKCELVIDCVTLDEELAGVTVHGIKIDAQGDDGWILEGAQQTLACMPAGAWLLFELWPEGLRLSGFDLHRLEALLSGWTVLAQGKTYHETTHTLAHILSEVERWTAHRHTNVLLRKAAA